MNRSIKNIELVFENIDYIVIPIEYFQSYNLNHIKLGPCCKDGSKCYRYAEMHFILKKEVNEDALTFENNVYVMQAEDKTLFERIVEYKDLTHVNLIYTDKSTEEYIVLWEAEDNNEYRNRLLKTRIMETGNLCVEVRKR